MGAVAIMKAMKDYVFSPSSIMLECPFGSLYQSVSARFDILGVPSFPMAGILTFWGGFQQGYWAFNHNPTTYAKSVNCPALLMFGEEDDRVSMKETLEIYRNMPGRKVLATYPNVGHNIFTPENQQNWVRDVSSFMQDVQSPEVAPDLVSAQ